MQAPGEVNFRRQVDQGLLVPGDDVHIEPAGDDKEQEAADRHALGKVDAGREGIDPHLHFATRTDDR